MNVLGINFGAFNKNYSDGGFWKKIGATFKLVGLKGIYRALILYYVLQKKELKKSEKIQIIGALGYLITPIDLIPDFIPLKGFLDDIIVLCFVNEKVKRYIDKEVEFNAFYKLCNLFELTPEDIEILEI